VALFVALFVVDSEPLPPEALPAGTLLGSLRIERALARGASAALYLATDVDTNAPLAVKVLCPVGGDDDERQAQRARFLREAEHASALDHPNIVRIFGGGQVREAAFLAMEFLPGSNLTRWTGQARCLPEAAVLDIAAQLAEALAHAHRKGIVHRDVKPANAIFDPGRRHVTLTDFGIARAPDAQATRSGLLVGSPSYMAPELLAGAPPDARSDLYALGVLTFELLAGRPPFDQPSMGALLRAVATEPPPPLASVRPELKGAQALDALLAGLLAKDPAARVADGSEWAARARVQQLWLTAPALDLG
jgi:eukaryotic-like serine/threonine-protein kinase